MQDFIRAQLENEIATGGALVVVFGAVVAMLRDVPSYLWKFAKRRLVVEIDVADHDPAFFWVQSWLAHHPYARRARLLTVSTRRGRGDNEGNKQRDLTLTPAPGVHLIWHCRSPVLLYRYRWKPDGGFSDLMYREQFSLFAFSRGVVASIIDEAQRFAQPGWDGMMGIYRSHYERWLLGARRRARPLDSVVLDGALGTELLDDLRTFTKSYERYESLGVPYQRGYLLTGPPGSGKTSVVTALAGAVGRDLYVVQPSAVTDSGFDALMANVPDDGIVLIEDIDCVFQGRQRVESGGFQPLTFSGFINAIDGVAAPHGRILFMTTNHPEKLDPALMRAGRVDVVRVIGAATPEQARRMFLRFNPDAHGLAFQFADTVANCGREVSMAELQEWLLREHPPEKLATFVPVNERT